MKTKLNFLLVLTLLVILVVANTGTAAAYVGITIDPETLPSATYNKWYSQQLTADGGTGPYSFTLVSGTLPYEISLSDSGLLEGFPDGTSAIPGTYPITIQVQDTTAMTATRTYDFVLDKGTPGVTIYGPYEPYWNSPFDLYAEVNMDTGLGYSYLLPGTVAFSIDGTPVPGCDAVPYDEVNSGYPCQGVSMLLGVGLHMVEAAYTPSESYADYYNPASNSKEFTVQTSLYYIMGSLFGDSDQDGVWNYDTEYTLAVGWTVNLDQGCDETVDFTAETSGYYGYYQFLSVPGGYTYCLSVNADSGYVQTTQVEPFYLSENIESLDVGFYYPTITISPDTLSGAEYNTPYSQQLTASGGTEPYVFSLLGGSLPYGITLNSNGLLSGLPDGTTLAKPGIYPITIQVQDANLDTASRTYDLVLIKGTPTVKVSAPVSPYWNSSINLYAEVLMKTSNVGGTPLVGTVAFTIDDVAVTGCDAVSPVDYEYICEGVSMNLSVGPHTVNAAYTPTGSNIDYYSTAHASFEFTVQTTYYNIAGTLFRDQDQDDVFDSDEYTLSGWTVNLDQGCNGTVDGTYTTDYWGSYNFYNIAGGQCYRLTVDEQPGYQRTTPMLADFVLSGNILSENVGFYYPTITLSPDEIPSGSVGVEYIQTFTASGGTEPYTFSVLYYSLPDGLTLSEAGVLSGTPTTGGNYYVYVQAEDATHAVGNGNYVLDILVDGTFTFTASPNPSAPDEPVTFTVSATGDANHYYYGPTPPMGTITFFADGTAIEGCSDLYLNLIYDEFGDLGPADNPAVCTTAVLGTGSHQITADFYDWTDLYNTPVLALTQEVQALTSADLTISMTDNRDPVKPGARLVYTLTVSNAGPDVAQDLTLEDTLDKNTTYLSVSAPQGWMCTYSRGKVTCTSASLSSGSSASINITVTVKKTAPVGKNLVNTANVTSTTFDQDLMNNRVVQKTRVSR